MQVLDSLIEGPLRLRNRREGDELIGMIVRYLATGEDPEPRTDAQEAVVTSIMPVLTKSRARIKAGSNGGSKQPSKPSSKTASKSRSKTDSEEPSEQPSKTRSKAPSEEELGRGERKEEQGKGSARFRAPTADEVSAYASEYCASHGLDPSGFDPGRFIDHYTGNGWRVGRVPMRDWKATVRNWCRNDCKPTGGGEYARYDR